MKIRKTYGDKKKERNRPEVYMIEAWDSLDD